MSCFSAKFCKLLRLLDVVASALMMLVLCPRLLLVEGWLAAFLNLCLNKYLT